jgi:hypothetical protein
LRGQGKAVLVPDFEPAAFAGFLLLPAHLQVFAAGILWRRPGGGKCQQQRKANNRTF